MVDGWSELLVDVDCVGVASGGSGDFGRVGERSEVATKGPRALEQDFAEAAVGSGASLPTRCVLDNG